MGFNVGKFRINKRTDVAAAYITNPVVLRNVHKITTQEYPGAFGPQPGQFERDVNLHQNEVVEITHLIERARAALIAIEEEHPDEPNVLENCGEWRKRVNSVEQTLRQYSQGKSAAVPTKEFGNQIRDIFKMVEQVDK